MYCKPDAPIYRDADLIQKLEAITSAAAFWSRNATEYIAENGDQGTCVLGAGIAVSYLPKGARKPRALMLIGAPGGQGCLSWEDSVEMVLKYLKSLGIEGWYEPGRMD